MRDLKKLGWILFFCLFTGLNWAGSDLSSWFIKEENQIILPVDIYLSTTCPHCQKGDAFLKELESKTPWLKVHRHFIDQDKKALESFHQQLLQQNSDDYAVPAFFFCNTRWVGFDDPARSGKNLLRGLNYCHDEILKKGSLDAKTVDVLNQLSNASWFNENMNSQPSVSVYTAFMATADSLSPCSFFVLFVLFSFLWLYKELKTAVSISLVSMLVLMIVHHFQESHLTFLLPYSNWIRILAAVVGLILMAYSILICVKGRKTRPNYSIPILVGAVIAFVQLFQQNCRPNFGLIYQLWMDTKNLPINHLRSYEFLYQLIYIIPLVFIAFLLIFFREHQRLKRIDSYLDWVAWSLLVMVGLLLIFYPQAFSSLFLSLVVLAISLVLAWINRRRQSRIRDE